MAEDDVFPDDEPQESTGEQPEGATSDRAPDGRFVPGNRAGFQPGQSGNPAGRPKGWRALFREHAEGLMPGDVAGRTRLAILMEALLHEALPRKEQRTIIGEDGRPHTVTVTRRGNVSAAREYLDRADGRVPIALKPAMDDDDPESLAEIELVTVGGDGVPLVPTSAKPKLADGQTMPKEDLPE